MPEPKEKPGKKRTYTQLKEKRQYSITKEAHDRILVLAKLLGINSRSELIEKIGREEVSIYLPSQSDFLSKEIPILSRLMAIMKKPSPSFKSTLYVARILAFQLGITDEKKDFYKSEKIVIDAVRTAFVILALEDFLYPEQYLLDVTSVMQYLVFKILIGKAGLQEQTPSPSFDEFLSFYRNYPSSTQKEIAVPLKQIFNAFSQLKVNYPQEYQILHMRMIQGLSYSKICSLLRIRGTDLNKEEGFTRVREAIYALRQSWHAQRAAGITTILNPIDQELLDFMNPMMAEAQGFYELTQHDRLNGDDHQNERKVWEMFLIKTMIQPRLGLWVSDVCHARGHEFDEPSHTTNEQLNQYQSDTTAAIAKGLDEEIRQHLETLKNRLRFKGIQQGDLSQTFLETVNEIGRINLSPLYFSEKRKQLEGLCFYNSHAKEIKDSPYFIFDNPVANVN